MGVRKQAMLRAQCYVLPIPTFKRTLKDRGFGPEPIRWHRLACGYGPRRPSTLTPHSIEAIEVWGSETAGSPPRPLPILKTEGWQEVTVMS